MRATGHATEGNKWELNNIDIALKKILFSTEESLKLQPRTNRHAHFSKALDEEIWMVVYWWKRVTILMTNTPQEKLATAMSQSGLKEDDIRWHPRVRLRKAHRNFDRVKRDIFSKR